MNIEQLTASIAKHDPLLATAVSRMVGYIQDKWAAPFPSKEQTEAVNAYLRSVHADGDGTMNETNIEHRRIAGTTIRDSILTNSERELYLCRQKESWVITSLCPMSIQRHGRVTRINARQTAISH